jgi:hypothetical protein
MKHKELNNEMNITSEPCEKCGGFLVVTNGKKEKCTRCGEVPQWLIGQPR